ncbi:brain-specific angiogenesis inhibitor 1-associated protein 2-like protein 2 [Parambassis ranga]|uniref:Brain-specific angiogenesis inhibitor 1-associated protein 2-like protein 2 n=1 Tax=Parambassis ranga TaxID=210632 RepID=A0A6P7ITV0_9TELE|nr:brain-specific angiogenesis inhibitor 1-associated protein 2-like protein 2 [Parambassis ranga]
MSGMNSDQLHRSTLSIYTSLMDEFNPSLLKLVSLGNSYVQAFKALAVTGEAYFSALSKIGEKALHTISSRPIGDVLIQISESQRRLTLELEGVFRWFSLEVLQEMSNNVHLDRDYISHSRQHYEREVHIQAATLETQRRRGAFQDNSEREQFLRESHSGALQEEERRYRFLAEKHCGLIQSFSLLMNKTGGTLQQRAEAWTERVSATRRHRPAALDISREEEVRKMIREEMTLGNIPSRAPSPQGSVSRSDSAGCGGQSMRAKVAHEPASSSPTLLPFTRGQMITVLVQQPRNGWLYGRTDSSSRPGWFPASYVEAVDGPPVLISSSSALKRNSSLSNLLDQSPISRQTGAPPPPPPPPPQTSNNQPITPTPDRRPEATAENKRSQPHGSRPELFPRGTNPFATVKLKPTSTNDRSAPRLNRR